MEHPTCPECDNNLRLMNHLFSNNTLHCKAICENCYWMGHVPQKYLEIVDSIYTEELWKQTKRKRKSFKKRLKKQKRLERFYNSKIAAIENRATPVLKIKNVKLTTRPTSFYETRGWQELRYATLKKYGRKCMVCFITDTELHVDHIVPISKDKSKALDPTNLQVLCRACNMGKSNKDQIDWRPSV